MNNPRLLLIYGPGSGLGKSTLCSALAERLAAQGITVRVIAEEEIPTHPSFQAYVHSVQSERGDDISSLIDSCRHFVVELNTLESEIVILDSILPCWDWLYSANCSDTDVAAFSRILDGMISSLCPVLVYIEGNQDGALSRVIADRGTEWALDLAGLRTGQRDLAALGTYFRRLRAGTEKMLLLWPYPVIRVNTETDEVTRELQLRKR